MDQTATKNYSNRSSVLVLCETGGGRMDPQKKKVKYPHTAAVFRFSTSTGTTAVVVRVDPIIIGACHTMVGVVLVVLLPPWVPLCCLCKSYSVVIRTYVRLQLGNRCTAILLCICIGGGFVAMTTTTDDNSAAVTKKKKTNTFS